MRANKNIRMFESGSQAAVRRKAEVRSIRERLYAATGAWLVELVPPTGAIVAVLVVVTCGRPAHAITTFWLIAVATGLALNLGLHRLFSHRSFRTFRSVEWTLMILGAMASTRSPFHWVATHRVHHRHSDRDGDPHSPRARAGALGAQRGFWHGYCGWLYSDRRSYPAEAIPDLIRRRDLAWIDRHWFGWYLVGLAIPALVGALVGGTVHDALIGFLWAGLFRHFAVLQIPFMVNAVCHCWGSRPYDIPDQSRNNAFLAIVALGDGWHNNHHAFPSFARHGFYWWQLDFTWSVILLMESMGLAWNVKRPDARIYRGPTAWLDVPEHNSIKS